MIGYFTLSGMAQWPQHATSFYVNANPRIQVQEQVINEPRVRTPYTNSHPNLPQPNPPAMPWQLNKYHNKI